MTFNNPPQSFFEPDDEDADTQMDHGASPHSQAPFNAPYSSSSQGQAAYTPNPNIAPSTPYVVTPNAGYGPDHSQQMTNLGGAASPAPQNGHGQPPTYLPTARGNWDAGGETRLDISDQPQTVQPLGLLIVKRPLERRGYAYHVRGSSTIGRRTGKPGDVLLAADDLVSEHHAIVRLSDPTEGEPAFWIADMNSRNGTKLNGIKIDGRCRLQDGDEIVIGRSVFVFMMLKD